MALTKRQEQILAAIVDSYISTGEPIGSGAISGELAVSSATVRNEMAVLSAQGYIEQPHTSAGRVPSEKGYRYYVDHLLGTYDAGEDMRYDAETFFENVSGSHDDILRAAVGKLAEISGFTAVASLPYDERASVTNIQLVPLGHHSALVVVAMSTGVVKSKICRPVPELGVEDARLFYRVADSSFIGKSLDDLSAAGIQGTVAAMGEKMFVIAPFIIAVYDLVRESFKKDVIVGGLSSLVSKRSYDVDMDALASYMQNSVRLARMLDSCKGELTVRIGHENTDRELSRSGLIISKYKVGGRNVGSLGLIGPVRMDYSKLIPCVRLFSAVVNGILSDTDPAFL